MPRLNETGAYQALAAGVREQAADAQPDPMEDTQRMPVVDRRYRMTEAKLTKRVFS